MSATLSPLPRPNVQRAPSVGLDVTYSTAFRAMPRAVPAPTVTETDIYLRRSHDLIARLRRAVAERTASSG